MKAAVGAGVTPQRSTNPISTKCTARSRCPIAPVAHYRKSRSASEAKSSNRTTPANRVPSSAPPRAQPAARRGTGVGGRSGSRRERLKSYCVIDCVSSQHCIIFLSISERNRTLFPQSERADLMKCPHCNMGIHASWIEQGIPYSNGQHSGWHVEIMVCPQCSKEILRLGKGAIVNHAYQVTNYRQIYPPGSNRGPVQPEVPANISADYTEAALVLPLSPKASAALSRRCLQSVLRDAGYGQRDLSKQIDAALAEADARKAIPSSVHMIVDAIRNIGNFAAHQITDQTTLQVIDVDSTEAEYCLDVLDSVFDHYYVKPAQAKKIKDSLNKKLAAAKKPPAK